MKLVFRREQHSNLMGGIIFDLDVRADLSGDEEDAIWRYGLGDRLLYEKYTLVVKGWGAMGRLVALLMKLIHHAINTSVRGRDLIKGKRVRADNIEEMVLIEKEILEEAVIFGALLKAAMNYNGEEAIPV